MALKDTSFIESMLALSRQSSSDASRNAGAIGGALRDIGSMFSDNEKRELAIENQRLNNRLRQDALERESKDYITSQNIQARLNPEKVAQQDIIREKAAVQSNIADLDKLLGSDVNKSTPQLTEMFKKDKESGLIDKGVTEEQYRDELRRTKVDLNSLLNGETKMNKVSSKDIFDPKARVKTAESRGDLATLGLTLGGDETAITKGVQEAKRAEQMLKGSELDIKSKEQKLEDRKNRKKATEEFRSKMSEYQNQIGSAKNMQDLLNISTGIISEYGGRVDDKLLNSFTNSIENQIKQTDVYKNQAFKNEAEKQAFSEAMKSSISIANDNIDTNKIPGYNKLIKQKQKIQERLIKDINKEPNVNKAFKVIDDLDIGSIDTANFKKFLSNMVLSGNLDGVSDNQLVSAITGSYGEDFAGFGNKYIGNEDFQNAIKTAVSGIKSLNRPELKNQLLNIDSQINKSKNDYINRMTKINSNVLSKFGVNLNEIYGSTSDNSGDTISTKNKEPKETTTSKSGRKVNIDNKDEANESREIGDVDFTKSSEDIISKSGSDQQKARLKNLIRARNNVVDSQGNENQKNKQINRINELIDQMRLDIQGVELQNIM